jgi:hypothetical protein
VALEFEEFFIKIFLARKEHKEDAKNAGDFLLRSLRFTLRPLRNSKCLHQEYLKEIKTLRTLTIGITERTRVRRKKS